MNNAIELKAHLTNFYGTENYFKHSFVLPVLYTDGARAFFVNAGGGAYWLLDIMALEIFPLLRDDENCSMYLIKFNVENSVGVISAYDSEEAMVYTRNIEWTDCPDGEWKFFMSVSDIDENDNPTQVVILLPSEY